ncbi:MAG TPA: adenylosuccinate lyase [Nitrospiraceae bacterium]|nr:MAG: adenylosuccinate lyase [Nitrospirae bacterium GWA2_46_11]OGW25244.1 MAG: adenylosuccinate lyase [Nitrospirae bacterium GWB2_47_37]HAK89534.1 adenylosuccinate lyase [Nitrospiraceae bacterium]HCZ10957.1 adenylosuccinate lyase [Nitrospiraceae bacterium]
MIPRYTRPEMGRLWEPENRFQKWLDVETAVCEAWAEMGEIPQDALKVIKEKAKFDIKRIDEIEKTVKHDVIAFLTSVAEFIGPESRFVHKGLTSSDVVDTALSLLMREAADIIIKDIKELMAVLKTQAFKYKDTPCIGRSHGVHAEPMTFGLKFALWYEDAKRSLRRMETAREAISVGKLSGAVGTFSNIPTDLEEKVCVKLGLSAEPVATQVVQRDRHAEYMTALALTAACIEKTAVEIRHLQRTEVLEAEEPFSAGQKGSSAMPHKRNPVGSENLSGLARVVRSNASAALENIALWHERDISHSSVERVIIPDSAILVDYMLNRLAGILKDMHVYPDRMAANMEKSHGLHNSQRVMLALTEKGISREDAYALVQKSAMESWREGESFKKLLQKDAGITKYLSHREIEEIFDLKYYLRNVDYIFGRVFGE